MAERDTLRKKVAELRLSNEALHEKDTELRDKASKSARAMQSLGVVVERMREDLLDYDAHDDPSGNRWDEVRVRTDVALREVVRVLGLLSVAMQP